MMGRVNITVSKDGSLDPCYDELVETIKTAKELLYGMPMHSEEKRLYDQLVYTETCLQLDQMAL
jgi:hypothetical protein